MSLREVLNNNSVAVTVGAVVLLCVALAIVLFRGMGTPPAGDIGVYWLDLNTNQLFAESEDRIPPIEATTSPGQTSGVRAHVVGCGECPSASFVGRTPDELPEGQIFVAYLERYNDRDAARMRAWREQAANDPDVGRPQVESEIRALSGDRWLRRDSNEAALILLEAAAQCPEGRAPVPCFPHR